MAAAMVEVEAMAEVAIMVEVVEETMEVVEETMEVATGGYLSYLSCFHMSVRVVFLTHSNFRTVQMESEAFLVAMDRGWWQLWWQWRWRWQLWWWKQ